MKRHIILFICCCGAISCGCQKDKEKNFSTGEIQNQINDTRSRFWALALKGDIDSMLSFHLDSSIYRLYENGKDYDYKFQADGHREMKSKGITAVIFNVDVKDLVVFGNNHAMETWDGKSVVKYDSGKADSSSRFIVTILYYKTKNGWKFSYLHSSNATN